MDLAQSLQIVGRASSKIPSGTGELGQRQMERWVPGGKKVKDQDGSTNERAKVAQKNEELQSNIYPAALGPRPLDPLVFCLLPSTFSPEAFLPRAYSFLHLLAFWQGRVKENGWSATSLACPSQKATAYAYVCMHIFELFALAVSYCVGTHVNNNLYEVDGCKRQSSCLQN